MMGKTYIKYIVGALLLGTMLINVAGCRKKPKEKGSNKAYCKIDGKKFFAKYKEGFTGCFYGVSVAIINDTVLFVDLNNCNPEKGTKLTLILGDFNGEGEYKLGIIDGLNYDGAKYDGYRHSGLFVTDVGVGGSLNITKYEEQNDGRFILAGKFAFTARQTNGNETVAITDGWFDVLLNSNRKNY